LLIGAGSAIAAFGLAAVRPLKSSTCPQQFSIGLASFDDRAPEGYRAECHDLAQDRAQHMNAMQSFAKGGKLIKGGWSDGQVPYDRLRTFLTSELGTFDKKFSPDHK
jgi:hypothetical protein